MSLFEHLVMKALNNAAGGNPLAMVVEKELLHHDILREMSGAGLLEKLTFMGGTCLRACYGSQRLSEDLDFTGGADFCRDQLLVLPELISDTLLRKYGLSVEVSEPTRESGNVDTWKVKVVTRPQQRGIPLQRINIDVCAAPSYDRKPMVLTNHYGVDMGTSGLILQVESREEILADKLIALGLRPGRIKNRDLWDIVWLKQQGITLPMGILMEKIGDHQHTPARYGELLAERCNQLMTDDTVHREFVAELKRFLPAAVVLETVQHADFWNYLKNVVQMECRQVAGSISGAVPASPFRMH